jgi:multidrug efflux pump subunit AcrA (membrane-fusion protein)
MLKLDQNQEGLRPGMSTIVAIPFVERDDVLMVPRAAVLHFDFDNKTIVKVKKRDGGFESREVVTGDLDEAATLIEIKQGLKPGEQVAQETLELLSDQEKSKRQLGKPLQ